MVANQRKILVTGATGQQGGSLARLLLQKKHKVHAPYMKYSITCCRNHNDTSLNLIHHIHQRQVFFLHQISGEVAEHKP
jgi:GDP-D-mannose dehydratase